MRSTMPKFESERLRALPIYLFEDLASKRREKQAAGVHVVDLSIGDPDIGIHEFAIDKMRQSLRIRGIHRYTSMDIVEKFNQAVANWMKKGYGVDLDPSSEIIPVIGTKEGLAHLPMALMDPGDLALVPNPAYPVYSRSVVLMGGRIMEMPLLEANGYLPDLAMFEEANPTLIYLNYPNNPTSAIADEEFFSEAIFFAEKTGSVIVNDAAYSEIVFDGVQSQSILCVEGAKEIAVEFHSFSKTFGIPGWRVGFAAGCKNVIQSLAKVKSNIDSGVFGAILQAITSALEDGWQGFQAMMDEYDKRRRMLIDALETAGLDYFPHHATLYIWVRVPGNIKSLDFASFLLDRLGVLVAPGIGFGSYGEGYFRISITCPTEEIQLACKRIREASGLWKS
ncbi:MAG: aminotransferase class I/II-fold pyridoxal phosphate-dependent enzyme [bacterium]